MNLQKHMTQPPTLATKRLLLRPIRMTDWPAYAALMMSERARFMDGPHSMHGAWGMFCHDVALWSLAGHGALMIDDRNSGACLGQVAVNAGPLFPERELGWLVYAGAEGRGIACEAAEALKAWFFRHFADDSIVSYIDPDNTRSIRLAERLGAFRDDAAARPAPGDLVYRHPRP